MKTALRFFPTLVVSILCALPLPAQEPALPSGSYQTEVTLGAAYLSGRYACFLAEEEAGFIKVATSPAGVLTGSITLLGQTEDFTGSLRSRPTGLRLLLRGKLREGGVVVKATLVGGNFVGTAAIRGKKAPIRIDVDGVGPLRARYQLMLATASNGAITGMGTMKTGQQEIPVTARGRTSRGEVSLAIKEGKKTVLRTSTGTTDISGFTAAKWTAEGFGALTKGINLRVTAAP